MNIPYEDQFYVKPVTVYSVQWDNKPIRESCHPSKLFFSGRRNHLSERIGVDVDYINTMLHQNITPVVIHEEPGYALFDGRDIKVGLMYDFQFEGSTPKEMARYPFPNILRTSDGYFASKSQADDVLMDLKNYFKALKAYQSKKRKMDCRTENCGVPSTTDTPKMMESFEDWIERKNNPKPKEKKIYQLKRTRLNPISKKQKKRLSNYKSAHERYLQEHPHCELCQSTENLSIHHKMGRGTYTDREEYYMTVCMVGTFLDEKYPNSNHHHTGGCHGWIEANKKLSRENGWILY